MCQPCHKDFFTAADWVSIYKVAQPEVRVAAAGAIYLVSYLSILVPRTFRLYEELEKAEHAQLSDQSVSYGLNEGKYKID